MPTMRICIVAEHASYQFGGEAVLPLHYFSRLRARGVEAWLVVHARTRMELEALFPLDRDRIRFVEDAWFHKLLFRLSRFLPRRVGESTVGLLSQLITQSLARQTVRKLVSQESIDIVHQPIPVSPRFPSLMARLGAPVVIGPMNGGMDYPPAFRHTESFFSQISVDLGRRLSGVVNSILPGKKLAKILLVANDRTRLALPPGARGRIMQLVENGVDLKTWSSSNGSQPASQARFVFIGRLVDWKCVDIAIEALSHVAGTQLEIIGDGPMRAAWQQLAERLGLSARVTFSGWLPQKMCALHLQSAFGLVLPSIYESGGAVVLEAMATGIPVIATQWGGPVDYLDSTCGFLIEPLGRERMVAGFADAMRKLVATPDLARQLGSRGRARVLEHFDWERKIDQMITIYRLMEAETGRMQLSGNGKD